MRDFRRARRAGRAGRAHSGASRLDAALGARGDRESRARARRRCGAERSIRRRNASARLDAGRAGVYRRRAPAVRVRRQPGASRGYRRDRAGLDGAGDGNLPGRFSIAAGENCQRRRDRARRDDAVSRQHARARGARGRPARADCRVVGRRRAVARDRKNVGTENGRGRDGRAQGLRGAPDDRGACRASAGNLSRRGFSRRRRLRHGSDSDSRRNQDWRRQGDRRFHRLRAAGARFGQRKFRDHAVGDFLRHEMPRGRGRARQRGPDAPDQAHRAAGLDRQRAGSSSGRGRQRRDLAADCRRSVSRARQGGAGSHSGGEFGLDVESHGRRLRSISRPPFFLLRNDRRRRGRREGPARRVRHPHSHDQHAQHADRGARGLLPDADHRVSNPARLGRTRSSARRRRTDSRTRVPGRFERKRAHRAADNRAVRTCRRRTGRDRQKHSRARHATKPGLPGKANIDLKAGERIRIETPGGGGWGRR